MTVSKAVAQKAKQDSVSAVQAYLTSLLYRRQEAQRDGLEPVAEILWSALAAIEEWLDTGEAPVNSREVLDSPLCHTLDFLLKWLAQPQARRQQIAQDIERYEVETGDEGAVRESRPRANKKIAS
jgi:hypothetical protein